MTGWFLAARPAASSRPPAAPSVSYTLTCTRCHVAAVKVRVETTHELNKREVPRFVRQIAAAQGWDCSARFVAGQHVEGDWCPTCREVR